MRRSTWFVMLLLTGCAGVEIEDDVPSPDGFGKADGEAFSVRGTLAYGDSATGTLYGTKTYLAYAFDALEGAQLAVTESSGKPMAVYGPLDRDGKYGPHSLASSAAGSAAGFTVPEDGRYLALVGGKRGRFSLSLACSAGCDLDPDAGKLALNRASKSELAAARLDADALLQYRDTYGAAATLDEVGLAGDAHVTPALHRVFFAPKIGNGWGWSAASQTRPSFLRREASAEVDWAPGNVGSAVVDLFRRAERTIDVSMYGMSLATDEGKALLAAAARGVKVRVYLDVSERDPGGQPYTASVIKPLFNTANVEVKVPKYSSKTMHEKFGIVDGVHVFDGSANVSTKARDVYTEDRFVFLASPGAAALFIDEFERLWNQLGKDAHTIVN